MQIFKRGLEISLKYRSTICSIFCKDMVFATFSLVLKTSLEFVAGLILCMFVTLT